jgi:hypothetical protein
MVGQFPKYRACELSLGGIKTNKMGMFNSSVVVCFEYLVGLLSN